MTTDKLPLRQQRFVDEYLIDLNATQAAIRAGYSAKTAHVQGPRLLGNVRIREQIERAQQQQQRRTQITADKVIAELAKIGFSDIRKAVSWRSNVTVAAPDERSVDEMLEDGFDGVRSAVTNQVELVDSDQIDDDTAAAISEISQNDKGGLKVKFYDKRAALVDLGRHLGVFTDGAVSVNVTVRGLDAFYSDGDDQQPASDEGRDA